MNIPKIIAKARFAYHANMLDVNNVLYQLGMRDGKKADDIGKEHCFKCLECLSIIGYDISSLFDKEGEGS